MPKQTVPVTERAVIQRINRKLAKEGKYLKATRGQQDSKQFGDFYIVNGRPGHLYVFDHSFDLEEKARQLGALRDYEHVVRP